MASRWQCNKPNLYYENLYFLDDLILEMASETMDLMIFMFILDMFSEWIFDNLTYFNTFKFLNETLLFIAPNFLVDIDYSLLN